MQLASLIQALSDPAAYPSRPDSVEVRQTHISAVFLAGSLAYKIKKPVNFGFLDFGGLEKRRHYCQEEVRLNARLAPGVYQGVVPITRDHAGLHVEGTCGEIVEWAVKMERLRDQDNLACRLVRHNVSTELVQEVARRIAAFHKSAERSPQIGENARFERVCSLIAENLQQAGAESAGTVSPEVIDRVGRLTDMLLLHQRARIDQRVAHGWPCDTHGDLRLEHIYVRRQEAEEGISIIDCIEFSDRYRYADPIADVAFLVMDFLFHGRDDLARALMESYACASDDAEGGCLLPLYGAYRALVRSKVEALKAREAEVPETERARALDRVRAYWLLALGVMEERARRPCLLLVGGLPGTGKSHLARQLAERQNFVVIRSDVIRKELAGASAQAASSADFGQGIYAAPWTQRTYGECLRHAEKALLSGQRVLVDATFGSNAHREQFLELAKQLCVPAGLLICRADREVVRQRLANRLGDASDADWGIYEKAARGWEPLRMKPHTNVGYLESDGPPAEVIASAMDFVASLTASVLPHA